MWTNIFRFLQWKFECVLYRELMKSCKKHVIPFIRIQRHTHIVISDFPTVFWPQSQCEKGSFFSIPWGKIPNSVVIKLFVKIIMKALSNEIKS